jgi:hypothetical protein
MNPQLLNMLSNNVGTVVRLAVFGSVAVYGATNSLFNVEGGHRAVVFNRVVGVKEDVSWIRCGLLSLPI